MEDEEVEYPIWTSFYYLKETAGCYHVEWGQYDGPPISLSTVKKLTKSFFVANRERLKLQSIDLVVAGAYKGAIFSLGIFRFKDNEL